MNLNDLAKKRIKNGIKKYDILLAYVINACKKLHSMVRNARKSKVTSYFVFFLGDVVYEYHELINSNVNIINDGDRNFVNIPIPCSPDTYFTNF